MDSPSSSSKEPRVPGPDSEHRIPPPPKEKATIPEEQLNRSGVSVPVYPKLQDRPNPHRNRLKNASPYSLIFDAFLTLVSVAFCLLYYSEL